MNREISNLKQLEEKEKEKERKRLSVFKDSKKTHKEGEQGRIDLPISTARRERERMVHVIADQEGETPEVEKKRRKKRLKLNAQKREKTCQ